MKGAWTGYEFVWAPRVRACTGEPGCPEVPLRGRGATLIDTLREHDLVDEYRLMLHPVVFGQGNR
jgi:hypothetical protein